MAKGAAKMKVSDEVAIDIIGLNKWCGDFHVLRDINLTIYQGERIVVCGPSGSGKSTLIRCINRLEEHQKARIIVDNIELTNDLKRIDEVRREVGMVFQHFNLFPHLTVMENCTLAPIWVRKMPKSAADETAMTYLKRVKIPEQARKYPGQLSGGQQQRVAIARALVTDPAMLLADEPTGNLDSRTSEEIMSIFQSLNDSGKTVVLITHEPDIAQHAKRVVTVRDGVIQHDEAIQQRRVDVRGIAAAPAPIPVEATR
jgi:general L-amino acid transport system ATP-binding protein